MCTPVDELLDAEGVSIAMGVGVSSFRGGEDGRGGASDFGSGLGVGASSESEGGFKRRGSLERLFRDRTMSGLIGAFCWASRRER